MAFRTTRWLNMDNIDSQNVESEQKLSVSSPMIPRSRWRHDEMYYYPSIFEKKERDSLFGVLQNERNPSLGYHKRDYSHWFL